MARYIVSSLLAACGLFGSAEQAGAVAVGQLLDAARAPQLALGRSLLLSTSAPPPTACEAITVPATAPVLNGSLAQTSFSGPSAQFSKGSAILGGAVSALERIRMDQAQVLAAGNTPVQVSLTLSALPANAAPTGAGMVPGAGLVPSAGGLASTGTGAGLGCNRLALPLPRAAIASVPGRGSPIAGGDDFLQTRRLSISRTAFDGHWARVSRQVVSPQFLARHAELRALSHGRADLAAVVAINGWTNRRIRFTEDSKLFGSADYWAAAHTTLARGAGDCEDIAIAKMQLLAAMGVARSDMYLTIARDLARRADHAMLVVRMDGRYWLLDNSTDRVLDAQASYDYQPVLSFSEGRKWLHSAVLASAK
jgi:predicted transglutaminase-like cysteine proteinase